MAEPKKKSTRRNRRTRLEKNKYQGFGLIKCPKCSSLVKPHNVCPICGYYKDKKIVETGSSATSKVKTKVTKK